MGVFFGLLPSKHFVNSVLCSINKDKIIIIIIKSYYITLCDAAVCVGQLILMVTADPCHAIVSWWWSVKYLQYFLHGRKYRKFYFFKK